MESNTVEAAAAELDALATELLFDASGRGVPLVGETVVAGGDALEEGFWLVLSCAVTLETEITEAFSLKLDRVGVYAECFEGLTKLERGAIEDGRVKGADAEIDSSPDQGHNMLGDVDGATAGGRAETEAVTAKNKVIYWDFAESRHEGLGYQR